MSTENKQIILSSYKQKSLKSIDILEASMQKVKPFDASKDYTYDELEPYDALADRFVRAVEVLFKFMRSLQIYNEGISSETLRDRLLYAEKLGLITSVDLWIEMREVRNRIVHDYLPDQQKFLFDDIMNIFILEIRFIGLYINKMNVQ
jgi:hypothetical protein